jgi:hypothetical protein
MTPRVINYNDAGKLDMIKQIESSRMSWCLADVLNIYGDQGLSAGNGLWGPAASPVIYPDESPTVEFDPGPYGSASGIEAEGSLIAPQETIGIPLNNETILYDDSQAMPQVPMNSYEGSSRGTPRNINRAGSGASVGAPAQPIQGTSYTPIGNGNVNGVTPAGYQPVAGDATTRGGMPTVTSTPRTVR